MHHASFCENSHVILLATLSEVKGLVSTISQEEVELETNLPRTPIPYSSPQFRTETPVNSRNQSCWSLNSALLRA